MSEWPMVKLGGIARFVSGGTPDRSNKAYYLGQIPWISGADISDSGHVQIRRRITEEAAEQSATSVVESGTLLLVTRTSIGKIALAPKDLAFSQDITGIFPNDAVILRKYLESFIRSIGAEQLKTRARGVTIKGVNRKDVEELKIPLPPLGEQKRIAEILGEVSKAVELVSRQLEILDHGLKTKMWNDADESSHVSLDHYIQKITSGKSLKEGDSEDYQNSVLKISAVTTGYFNEMEVKPLPKSYDPPESHRANNGDILLSRANTTELVGASALVETSATNLFLPDKLWKLQLKDQVNAYFFWHLLQTKLVRSSISKASSGSGGSMKNISQKAFLAISVPEFSNEVQNQIGNIVREQRALRHLLHRKLSLLQELQKSLATRAFAGLL